MLHGGPLLRCRWLEVDAGQDSPSNGAIADTSARCRTDRRVSSDAGWGEHAGARARSARMAPFTAACRSLRSCRSDRLCAAATTSSSHEHEATADQEDRRRFWYRRAASCWRIAEHLTAQRGPRPVPGVDGIRVGSRGRALRCRSVRSMATAGGGGEQETEPRERAGEGHGHRGGPADRGEASGSSAR